MTTSGIGSAREIPTGDPDTLTLQFPSQTQEQPVYTLVVGRTGKAQCSCPGFFYHRHCKHVKAVLEGRVNIDLKDRDWMAHVIARFKSRRSEEFDQLCTIARQWLGHNETITADVFHRVVVGFDSDSRIIGAVLRHLAARGEVESTGVRRSDRNICHNRVIQVFKRGPKWEVHPC